MGFDLSTILSGFPQKLRRILTLRFDKSPVDTVSAFVEFIHTRAAYVTQTSLYGYLKTRMGTRYPSLFKDPLFSKSISIAKWHIFAASLSDLTVFAVATAKRQCDMSDAEAAALARECYGAAIAATFDEAPEEVDGLADTARADFAERCEGVVWHSIAEGEAAFTKSPNDFYKWSPIADELKQYDEEIVTNSIRFRWRDVREQLRTRVDGASLCADWRAASHNA